MEVRLSIAVKRIPKLPGHRLDGVRLHLSGLRITPVEDKRGHKPAHFLETAQRIKGNDDRRIGITRSEKSTRHRLAVAYAGDKHLERGVIIERRALTLGDNLEVVFENPDGARASVIRAQALIDYHVIPDFALRHVRTRTCIRLRAALGRHVLNTQHVVKSAHGTSLGAMKAIVSSRRNRITGIRAMTV